jgi:PleD family two-component response regulator
MSQTFFYRAESLPETTELADARLYRAKERGKNQICLD